MEDVASARRDKALERMARGPKRDNVSWRLKFGRMPDVTPSGFKALYKRNQQGCSAAYD